MNFAPAIQHSLLQSGFAISASALIDDWFFTDESTDFYSLCATTAGQLLLNSFGGMLYFDFSRRWISSEDPVSGIPMFITAFYAQQNLRNNISKTVAGLSELFGNTIMSDTPPSKNSRFDIVNKITGDATSGVPIGDEDEKQLAPRRRYMNHRL